MQFSKSACTLKFKLIKAKWQFRNFHFRKKKIKDVVYLDYAAYSATKLAAHENEAYFSLLCAQRKTFCCSCMPVFQFSDFTVHIIKIYVAYFKIIDSRMKMLNRNRDKWIHRFLYSQFCLASLDWIWSGTHFFGVLCLVASKLAGACAHCVEHRLMGQSLRNWSDK